ncbi:hypothetical protein DY000_02009913 [Brassica cretica]|uniref:Uncharacterized protein n=1 Tax=Brassica cretica TaxID=69181 RepID=A0ABQ7C7L6_BRACR|nr:hypothetical protein DY000_02009913 [Brassica cretica]
MELTRRDSGLYVETNQRQGRRGGFGRRDCGRRRWLQKSFHGAISLSVTSSEAKRDSKLREKWNFYVSGRITGRVFRFGFRVPDFMSRPM